MARGTIIPTTLLTNGGTVSAGIAVDQANGQAIAATGLTRNIIIQVLASAVGTLIVRAGAYPPAFRAQQGDISVPIANAATTFVTVESARVVQLDGSINLDYSAGFTGTLTVYRLPNDL